MERIFKIARYVAVLIVVVFVISYFINNKENDSFYKGDPKMCTTLRDDGFMYNEFLGGIHNAKFTIENNCDFAIKDVRVLVTYIRKNGNAYKQAFVDIDFVAAKSSASYSAPDSDAGTTLKYEIYSLNSN